MYVPTPYVAASATPILRIGGFSFRSDAYHYVPLPLTNAKGKEPGIQLLSLPPSHYFEPPTGPPHTALEDYIVARTSPKALRTECHSTNGIQEQQARIPAPQVLTVAALTAHFVATVSNHAAEAARVTAKVDCIQNAANDLSFELPRKFFEVEQWGLQEWIGTHKYWGLYRAVITLNYENIMFPLWCIVFSAESDLRGDLLMCTLCWLSNTILRAFTKLTKLKEETYFSSLNLTCTFSIPSPLFWRYSPKYTSKIPCSFRMQLHGICLWISGRPLYQRIGNFNSDARVHAIMIVLCLLTPTAEVTIWLWTLIFALTCPLNILTKSYAPPQHHDAVFRFSFVGPKAEFEFQVAHISFSLFRSEVERSQVQQQAKFPLCLLSKLFSLRGMVSPFLQRALLICLQFGVHNGPNIASACSSPVHRYKEVSVRAASFGRTILALDSCNDFSPGLAVCWMCTANPCTYSPPMTATIRFPTKHPWPARRDPECQRLQNEELAAHPTTITGDEIVGLESCAGPFLIDENFDRSRRSVFMQFDHHKQNLAANRSVRILRLPGLLTTWLDWCYCTDPLFLFQQWHFGNVQKFPTKPSNSLGGLHRPPYDAFSIMIPPTTCVIGAQGSQTITSPRTIWLYNKYLKKADFVEKFTRSFNKIASPESQRNRDERTGRFDRMTLIKLDVQLNWVSPTAVPALMAFIFTGASGYPGANSVDGFYFNHTPKRSSQGVAVNGWRLTGTRVRCGVFPRRFVLIRTTATAPWRPRITGSRMANEKMRKLKRRDKDSDEIRRGEQHKRSKKSSGGNDNTMKALAIYKGTMNGEMDLSDKPCRKVAVKYSSIELLGFPQTILARATRGLQVSCKFQRVAEHHFVGGVKSACADGFPFETPLFALLFIRAHGRIPPTSRYLDYAAALPQRALASQDRSQPPPALTPLPLAIPPDLRQQNISLPRVSIDAFHAATHCESRMSPVLHKFVLAISVAARLHVESAGFVHPDHAATCVACPLPLLYYLADASCLESIRASCSMNRLGAIKVNEVLSTSLSFHSPPSLFIVNRDLSIIAVALPLRWRLGTFPEWLATLYPVRYMVQHGEPTCTYPLPQPAMITQKEICKSPPAHPSSTAGPLPRTYKLLLTSHRNDLVLIATISQQHFICFTFINNITPTSWRPGPTVAMIPASTYPSRLLIRRLLNQTPVLTTADFPFHIPSILPYLPTPLSWFRVWVSSYTKSSFSTVFFLIEWCSLNFTRTVERNWHKLKTLTSPTTTEPLIHNISGLVATLNQPGNDGPPTELPNAAFKDPPTASTTPSNLNIEGHSSDSSPQQSIRTPTPQCLTATALAAHAALAATSHATEVAQAVARVNRLQKAASELGFELSLECFEADHETPKQTGGSENSGDLVRTNLLRSMNNGHIVCPVSAREWNGSRNTHCDYDPIRGVRTDFPHQLGFDTRCFVLLTFLIDHDPIVQSTSSSSSI
ncbi:uncharacterized protein BDR25DRAFT_360303 [Lindgomyces ingoldianus]|uniref:Uncharacterized protein n=1 Tax=Lindgomyces ingoldianus TaxID=673940 RepID=A0ACB6QHF2_9PLEO|nr:uncharacterized protein BDR25DRAFT_360303 [Lindgomyces ingoldianus]KAF2465777.1 hypothetical protein BDR25DRAFT_360303 [Lindgomyces ingoldianus]